jgi:hypothetical protein
MVWVSGWEWSGSVEKDERWCWGRGEKGCELRLRLSRSCWSEESELKKVSSRRLKIFFYLIDL